MEVRYKMLEPHLCLLGPCTAPGEKGKLGQDSIQFRSHTTARPQGSSVVEPRVEGWSQEAEGAYPRARATQPDVLGALTLRKSEMRWGYRGGKRRQIIWEREKMVMGVGQARMPTKGREPLEPQSQVETTLTMIF